MLPAAGASLRIPGRPYIRDTGSGRRDVQFVFLRFEIIEELADRIHDECAFVGSEIAERDVQSNAAALGGLS